MKHFELIGRIDVEPIKKQLMKCINEWFDLTFRQTTPGSAHIDTQTIYLRMPEIIDHDSIFNSLDVIDYPLMDFPTFRNTIERIEDLTYQKAARAMIVSLDAGGIVKPHIDQGAYAEATDRYHLCLTTNPRVFMKIGDEVVCANPEELWWFDKHVEHTVENQGDTARVHLIVDCFKD